jgi:hypothetical protein
MNGRPADVVLDMAKAEVFPAPALARQTDEVRHLDYHATAYFISAHFEVQKHDYGSHNLSYCLVEFAKSARFAS